MHGRSECIERNSGKGQEHVAKRDCRMRLTVKDREADRARVFAFALPHFFTKVGNKGIRTLHRVLYM